MCKQCKKLSSLETAIIFMVLSIIYCGLANAEPVIFGSNGEVLEVSRPAADYMESLHKKNQKRGSDFRPSVQISDDIFSACRSPCLHVLEDNTIYAVIAGSPGGNPTSIFFTSSRDTGKTWLKPNIIIQQNPADIYSVKYPSMDVSQDWSIYVVWQEFSSTYPFVGRIMFSRSTDGGFNWSNPLRIDDGDPVNHTRTGSDIVCLGKDTLVASWGEGPYSSWSFYPWVRISFDGGITWIWENKISCVPPISSGYPFRTYIRFDPLLRRFYVLWPGEDGGGDIYVARSTDLGVTWMASVATIDNIARARYASMDIGSNGELYVAWTEQRWPEHYSDVFISKSTDGGVTWSNSVLISDHIVPYGQLEPHVSVDKKGIVHVAFSYGASNIEYSMSTDGGNNWLTPNIRVNDNKVVPHVPYTLSIASDTSSFVYVSWAQSIDFGDGPAFFSTNRPAEPGTNEVPITPNAFSLHIPTITKGKTNIEFTLPEKIEVNLLAYDVIGRLQKVLASQIFSAGSHKINANFDLPAGIYFVKFEAGDYWVIRKLLMIR